MMMMTMTTTTTTTTTTTMTTTTNDETNHLNEHNKVKNPNWQEADQLAIYKHDRGVELGSARNNSG